MINYLVFRFFAALISVMPFRLVYALSDIVYFVIYPLLSYRKKVVMANLRAALPGRSSKELNAIAREFYHRLADLLVEGLKGFGMGAAEVKRRHRIKNPQLVDAFFNTGRSVIGVTGHYGNWEWGAFSSALQISHPVFAFYKPLLNKRIDNYMKRKRAAHNCRLVSVSETFDTFQKNVSLCSAFIMVADQSPSNIKDSYWVNFLGRKTACIHGPEKYARMYNLPVVYIHINRVKRGFYEVELELITDNPVAMAEGALTARFMNILEKDILEEPAGWLWSHKRWKHSPVIPQDTFQQ